MFSKHSKAIEAENERLNKENESLKKENAKLELEILRITKLIQHEREVMNELRERERKQTEG